MKALLEPVLQIAGLDVSTSHNNINTLLIMFCLIKFISYQYKMSNETNGNYIVATTS